MKRNLLAIASLVVAALVASPGSSGGTPGRERAPTPALLERAVDRGALGRSQADLYLLYALGGDGRLPHRFRSDAPWDGTLPLLHLRRRMAGMAPGPQRARLRTELEAQALATCGGESGGANSLDTTHFHIEYGTIAGGLTIGDYGTSLETSWTSEVTTLGWAAPPLSSARYLVVVSNLGSGLYGFVTSTGTAGNNPNTSWNDGDSRYSCMALNRDYSGFPSPPQESLDATTAHEFNHSIQFGYGALNGTVPDDVFVEGGASWMEDEVFDDSDDNYFFLWPNFADGMDTYNSSPYAYWITYRGLTERYGVGVAGGGEQVMQDFWELVSQNAANNSAALDQALGARGTNLSDAFHAHAIAAKFMRACGGGYAYPHCFEEGPGYVAVNGLPAVHKTIPSVGGGTTGSIEGLALNWVQLPKDAGVYDLTLENTGTGGVLRGSAVCDTGTGFEIAPFPSTVAGGGQSTLTGFDSAGCLSAVAVLTNQEAGGGRGTASYELSTAGGGGGGSSTLAIGNAQVVEGNTGSKTMVFTVTLTPASGGTVTVHWATKSGGLGATVDVDYRKASGDLTFLPGQTSRPISVRIYGDTIDEGNERFKVLLSNPSGATISDGVGVGKIIDND